MKNIIVNSKFENSHEIPIFARFCRDIIVFDINAFIQIMQDKSTTTSSIHVDVKHP